ncbi:MAG: Flp pilus assembly protein CpaB [Chloroflexota bacterium]
MKNNGLFWWLGAVVFAALAGVMAFAVLSNASDSSGASLISGPTRSVIVAAVDIPFRRSISDAELVLKEFPIDAVPEGTATSMEQVLGKMSSVDLFEGEPILVQQLVTPDIVTQEVALSIPDGKIVMAVPTQSKLISNRLMRPGDKIDLMSTFELEVIREQGSGPLATSVGLLQNLEVHAIILPASNLDGGRSSGTQEEGGVFRTSDERGQSLLLAIEPQDALTIRHILDVGGHLDVALRAPNDESATDTVVVDQFYLAERFQIDLIRGLR